MHHAKLLSHNVLHNVSVRLLNRQSPQNSFNLKKCLTLTDVGYQRKRQCSINQLTAQDVYSDLNLPYLTGNWVTCVYF